MWEKASEYPLFGILRDRDSYHFTCVSRGTSIDCMDENKSLIDLNPFINILKLVERAGDETEKLVNHQIGTLIGKGLKEFDALRNPEVNDFRWKIRIICDEVVGVRTKEPWGKQVQYHYPCRIAKDPGTPDYIHNKISKDGLFFGVQFETSTKIQSIMHCKYFFLMLVSLSNCKNFFEYNLIHFQLNFYCL